MKDDLICCNCFVTPNGVFIVAANVICQIVRYKEIVQNRFLKLSTVTVIACAFSCILIDLQEFCLGNMGDLKTGCIGWDFNYEVMRSHLEKCLSQKKFMPFPKVLKRTKGKFRHINYNLVPHCFCGLPSCFDNLIVCSGHCRKWYYYTCVNVDPDSVPDQWCCQECE